MKDKSRIIEKVWGSEEWLANTEKYCGKILSLKPGFISSLHYHKNKDETFYILQGRVYFKLNEKEMIFMKGDTVRVKPEQKHQFASLGEQCRIIEISTHHEESDSYRETQSQPVDLEKLKSSLKDRGILK
jgi:mannose-6-phosphate isomerase-like protein (cupin superfamily)